jgi:hypothetical protein
MSTQESTCWTVIRAAVTDCTLTLLDVVLFVFSYFHVFVIVACWESQP